MNNKICGNCPDKPDMCPVGPRTYNAREICKAYHRNAPEPDVCPTCSGELNCSPGMVGEDVLWCKEHGVVWEDHGSAIARVI